MIIDMQVMRIAVQVMAAEERMRIAMEVMAAVEVTRRVAVQIVAVRPGSQHQRSSTVIPAQGVRRNSTTGSPPCNRSNHRSGAVNPAQGERLLLRASRACGVQSS